MPKGKMLNPFGVNWLSLRYCGALSIRSLSLLQGKTTGQLQTLRTKSVNRYTNTATLTPTRLRNNLKHTSPILSAMGVDLRRGGGDGPPEGRVKGGGAENILNQ